MLSMIDGRTEFLCSVYERIKKTAVPATVITAVGIEAGVLSAGGRAHNMMRMVWITPRAINAV